MKKRVQREGERPNEEDNLSEEVYNVKKRAKWIGKKNKNNKNKKKNKKEKNKKEFSRH